MTNKEFRILLEEVKYQDTETLFNWLINIARYSEILESEIDLYVIEQELRGRLKDFFNYV